MKRAPLIVFLLFVGTGAAVVAACPPRPPPSRGNGMVAGVPVAGGTQYYFKDALLAGFDCFELFGSWFPSYNFALNAISPGHVVVDMAYAAQGTATFFNVAAPANANYTLTIRYAYATGLYPGVKDRPEGIKVNGVVITSDMHFPVTGSFEAFAHSTIVVPLNAGKNTVEMFNIAGPSIARADAMTVTAAPAAHLDQRPGRQAEPVRTVALWAKSTGIGTCLSPSSGRLRFRVPMTRHPPVNRRHARYAST